MEHDNKKIEAIVDKLMQADSLEKAPLNFTNDVMSKIEALQESKTIVYQPLISKYVWWLMATGFSVLVGYLVFRQPNGNTSLSDRYGFPEVSFNLLEGLSSDFSSTLMYAIVLFTLMVGIQIPLLKQYFNTKLQY